MRADRLLKMLLLLHEQEHMTAHQLAAALEVSVRTVYRDIDALAIAGIPIYTQPGTNGGVFLDTAYRVSLTGLSSQEIVSLFVASGMGPLSDVGLASAAEQSLLKLLAALPTIQREAIKQVRQRLYIDPTNWFQVVDSVPLIEQLQEAVWADRVIRMSYHSAAGEHVPRILEPYALVAKANIWYLIARKLTGNHDDEGVMRTYRIARIRDLIVTDQQFVRRADFDLAAFWAETCRVFEAEINTQFTPYSAIVAILPDVLWYFEHFYNGYFEILGLDNGWLRLRVTFHSFGDAVMHVLGIGTAIRVEEPRGLHDEVLATARAILDFHAAPDDQ